MLLLVPKGILSAAHPVNSWGSEAHLFNFYVAISQKIIVCLWKSLPNHLTHTFQIKICHCIWEQVRIDSRTEIFINQKEKMLKICASCFSFFACFCLSFKSTQITSVSSLHVTQHMCHRPPENEHYHPTKFPFRVFPRTTCLTQQWSLYVSF